MVHKCYSKYNNVQIFSVATGWFDFLRKFFKRSLLRILFSQDALFPRRINLKIYRTRVPVQFLTEHVQTLFVFCNEALNFLLHFWHIFAQRITFCWLFAHCQLIINQVQVWSKKLSNSIASKTKHRTNFLPFP